VSEAIVTYVVEEYMEILCLTVQNLDDYCSLDCTSTQS